jgi:hypothetical protein
MLLNYKELTQFFICADNVVKQCEILLNHVRNYKEKKNVRKAVRLLLTNSLLALTVEEIINLNNIFEFFRVESLQLEKLQRQLMNCMDVQEFLTDNHYVDDYFDCLEFLEEALVQVIDDDAEIATVSSEKTDYKDLIEEGLFTLEHELKNYEK